MCYVSGVYHYPLYCEFAFGKHWKCDLVSIVSFYRIFLSYLSLVFFSRIVCIMETSECVL